MSKKDSKNEDNPAPSFFENKGILAGIIIIVGIVLLAGILYATGTQGGPAAVPPEECGKEVISYVNTNLAAANSTATLVSVTEKDGVYQIAARYQAQDIIFYATKTCNTIFSGIRNLKATPAPTSSPGPTASPKPTLEPVKSAQPSVELFVMSFCPYGVQAEDLIHPVVDLLGTKANITVRYIATVQGTSVDSVKSLHGTPEVKEDLRQLCLAKYYPGQLWPYLKNFNAQCYPVWKNATELESCQKNVTATLGMDNQKIETCASGSEGVALLKADVAITNNYNVAGSPTLIMNGQRYSGSRTTEAFKEGICARFETPPAECSVNLSAQVAPASGSC